MINENERQVNKKQEIKNQKKVTSTLAGVVCTSAGSKIAPVYKRVYDKDLDRKIVQKVDETNLYEFIQASKSMTDLATLQKRFIELGEIPNVDPNLQHGVDTTLLPGDIHQLYSMVNDVNGNFNKLPDSVKAVFGSSQDYLSAILDGSYQDKLAAAFMPKTDNKEKQEVNNNE